MSEHLSPSRFLPTSTTLEPLLPGSVPSYLALNKSRSALCMRMGQPKHPALPCK